MEQLRIDEAEQKSIKLDKKDMILLSCLSDNSKIGINILAKHARLSKDAVIYRIRKLISSKVILGFYPNIDFSKFKMKIFHMFAVLSEANKAKQEEWIEKISQNPNVVQVIEYSDAWDIEVKIIAKNIENFDAIIENMIEGYDDIIQFKETSERIYLLADELPPKELRVINYQRQKKTEDAFYDHKDILILKALCENARASNYKIAKKVKLSPDTVRLRINKMMSNGIIKGFSLKLNLSLLGYHLHSFVCELSLFDFKMRKKIESYITNSSNIVSAKRMLGKWDLRFDLLTKTQPEFHHTIEEIKRELSSVIRRYEAWIVYQEHCFKTFPQALARL